MRVVYAGSGSRDAFSCVRVVDMWRILDAWIRGERARAMGIGLRRMSVSLGADVDVGLKARVRRRYGMGRMRRRD